MERRIEYGARYPAVLNSMDRIHTREYDTKEEAEDFVKSVNRRIVEAGKIPPIAVVVAREVVVGDWENVNNVEGA